MSILGKHIHDMSMHVSEEDRQYWNSKADREQIRGIEDSIKERVEDVTREIVHEVAQEVVENVSHEVVETVTREVVEHEVERVEMNVDWKYENLVTPNTIAKASERTKIGKLTINGNTVELFQAPAPIQEIPTPEPSQPSEPSEPTIIENPYDDTEIRNLINGLRTDLNGVHDWSQQQIDSMVREIISGYNFVDGSYDGWIGEDDLEHYLITKGILGEDGVSKGWAYLEVWYNELRGAVNELEMFTDDEGNPVTYEALQALIDARIQNGIAELDLDTKWALLDADHNELEWMMSGFRSQASQYDSFAQMYSAGLTQNNDSLTAAIMTEVDNRISTAKAEIGAQVNENLAGYVAYSDLDHAIATMFADDGEATAYISTAVQDGISSATISGDKVYINGETLINYLNQNSWNEEGVRVGQSSITVERSQDEDADKVIITPGEINVYTYLVDPMNNRITSSDITFTDPTGGSTTYGLNNISFADTYNHSSGISFSSSGMFLGNDAKMVINGNDISIVSGSDSGRFSVDTEDVRLGNSESNDTVYIGGNNTEDIILSADDITINGRTACTGNFQIAVNTYMHVVNGLVISIDSNPTL